MISLITGVADAAAEIKTDAKKTPKEEVRMSKRSGGPRELRQVSGMVNIGQ